MFRKSKDILNLEKAVENLRVRICDLEGDTVLYHEDSDRHYKLPHIVELILSKLNLEISYIPSVPAQIILKEKRKRR